MSAVAKRLNDAEAVTRRLYGVREDSRDECVHTIRKLEAQLRALLENEVLRGLPVLLHGRHRLVGMRVRGERKNEPLALPSVDPWLHGPWAIVLTPQGELVQARRVRVGPFEAGWMPETKPLLDSDLTAQDLHAVSRTICEALERHVASMEKTTGRYEQLRLLAFGIGEVLERLFPEPQ